MKENIQTELEKGKEYDNQFGYLVFEGEYNNGQYWNGNLKGLKLINGYGKGEMHDHKGNLIFKGEYQNGRIWKGREYCYKYGKDKDILSYEREYLKGKKNGYAKEYGCFGNLEFEGVYKDEVRVEGRKIYINSEGTILYDLQYLNEKGLQKGKKYDINGHLIYEGGLHNSYRRGEGKEYDINGNLIFEGEFYLENKRGREYNSKGKLIFEGEYDKNGKIANGIKYDYLRNNKLLKESQIINGEINGKVKEYFRGSLVFEGEYLNHKRNGKGKVYNSKGQLVFEGEYRDGKPWSGKGYNDQGKIEYEIKKGNGKIKEYHDGILIFEGFYLNRERNGKGKEYDFLFRYLKYEGEYKNGKKNGKGKEYYKNQLIFEGEFIDGKKHGKGKEYFNGELVYEGYYVNDKRFDNNN